MLNRNYSGSISQDRVSYYVHKDAQTSPEADLGHDRGISHLDLIPTIAWVMDVGNGEIESFNTQQCLLDFSISTQYIDEGRPYYLSIDTTVPIDVRVEDFEKGDIVTNHGVVVVGYEDADQPVGIAQIDEATGMETGRKEFYPDGPRLIVHDPRYEDGDYNYLPIRYLIWGLAYVPPAGSNGIEDEMDLARGQPREYISAGECVAYAGRDTDGHCLLDYDEIERFGTDPNNPDTDGDEVPDLLDLREYVYDRHADTPDFDNDGLRKELDPNNDDDCYLDGEEDVNLNGQQDGDETSNLEQDPECF